MNSNASSDIQTIVTDVLNSRPYTHRQDVDMSVAAVITAQHDLRFLASTVGAVLAQRMLPGMIVIADCTGQIEQPMQMTFDVIHSSQDVLTEVPEAKTVRVILVGVKQAASFMGAVTRAMDQIGIDAGIRALWTLHDDSRPADDRCFETLLDAWRNTPTAALLGAKQLDWQAKNLHNVGLYAGHHDVVSLVVDGEPDQEQYDGRQDVLSVSLSGALVPLATLRAFEGADPWFGTFAESTDLCRRICLGGGRVVVVPQARIAHRRARFEGIRSKNGRPVEDEDGRIDPYLAVREANAKYAYTDMHRSWWPLLGCGPSSSRWDWPCFAWRANSRIMHAASWRCRGVRCCVCGVLGAPVRGCAGKARSRLNRYPRCLRIIGRSGNGSTVAVRCATRGMSCCSVLLRRTICVNGCCVDGDWPSARR